MGTAICMWISLMFFASWVSPSIKRKIVGMGLITDITVHVVLQTMFGGDAAGRAGLLLAGVMINITMHAYRKMYGYDTPSLNGWVYHAGAIKPKRKR